MPNIIKILIVWIYVFKISVNISEFPTKISTFLIKIAKFLWSSTTFLEVKDPSNCMQRKSWIPGCMAPQADPRLHGSSGTGLDIHITTMYKIINGNLSIPTNDLIPNHRPSREGYYKQLVTMNDSYKFSFFPSTIRLWNTLPPFVIHSPTLDEFCTNLNMHYDNTCAQQSF